MPNAPHSLMPYAIAQKEEKTIGVHKAGENVTFCRSFHAYAMSDAVHLLSREQRQIQRDQPKKKKECTTGHAWGDYLRAKTDDGTFCTHGTFCAHISPAKMILA